MPGMDGKLSLSERRKSRTGGDGRKESNGVERKENKQKGKSDMDKSEKWN